VDQLKLKLQLVRDGKIILEMPLSPEEWSKKRLTRELDYLGNDCERILGIFTALSNETRLMMMKRLMEEEDKTMSFAGFMRDLDLNPKLVWENARKLREEGLLVKVGRGRYRCSEFGERSFIMMSFVLRRLLNNFEELAES
jgi:biotin operon repressor